MVDENSENVRLSQNYLQVLSVEEGGEYCPWKNRGRTGGEGGQGGEGWTGGAR